MTIAAAIGAALFFAFFIERAIEKFASDETKHQPWLVGLALVSGILVAVSFGIDLISAFLTAIGGDTNVFVSRIPFLGEVFTGIAIGFGSTFVHDVQNSLGTKIVVEPRPVTNVQVTPNIEVVAPATPETAAPLSTPSRTRKAGKTAKD
jgi:hypothetical protein